MAYLQTIVLSVAGREKRALILKANEQLPHLEGERLPLDFSLIFKEKTGR
jgi:hypothetical protein